jgi:SAM-dependent methyltransferase
VTELPWTDWERRRRRLFRPAWPAILRRKRPLSDHWGFDRGTPLDRYYIENFLAQHRADIRGSVLEVQDAAYTHRFGTQVEESVVLDQDPSNPRATLVADLADRTRLPAERFDCFILTQTLHLIYDLHAAVAGCHHVLRPGGVLLMTGPAVSRVHGGDYWRFTPASLQRILGEVFTEILVRGCGNLLAATAFLAGAATEEIPRRLLDEHDSRFPIIVAARAVKR